MSASANSNSFISFYITVSFVVFRAFLYRNIISPAGGDDSSASVSVFPLSHFIAQCRKLFLYLNLYTVSASIAQCRERFLYLILDYNICLSFVMAN
jgi:hypothetical protein